MQRKRFPICVVFWLSKRQENATGTTKNRGPVARQGGMDLISMYHNKRPLQPALASDFF